MLAFFLGFERNFEIFISIFAGIFGVYECNQKKLKSFKKLYSNRRLKSKGSTFFSFRLALSIGLNFGSLPFPRTWKILSSVISRIFKLPPYIFITFILINLCFLIFWHSVNHKNITRQHSHFI